MLGKDLVGRLSQANRLKGTESLRPRPGLGNQ